MEMQMELNEEKKAMQSHLVPKQPIRWLMSISLLFYINISWAGIEAIYGDWDGGDSGSEAIFGTMTITKSHLSWKGKAQGEPRCTLTYKQIPEDFGVKFKDQVGHEYVTAPDSRFQTFLLKIDGRKRCALGITHFRMTLREDIPDMLDYVGYLSVKQLERRGHFFRKSQD